MFAVAIGDRSSIFPSVFVDVILCFPVNYWETLPLTAICGNSVIILEPCPFSTKLEE